MLSREDAMYNVICGLASPPRYVIAEMKINLHVFLLNFLQINEVLNQFFVICT